MKKMLIVGLSLLAIGILNAQGPTGRAVTQITSLTTGVTINADTGVITTVSASTAALGSASFTVTNSAVSATSTVVANVQGYSGTYTTNGTPEVTVGTVAAGSFVVNVLNVHTTNALSGTLNIGFVVR